MKIKNILFLIFLSIIPLLHVDCQLSPERQCPGFRGYFSSGILDSANLPESFDLDKMINIRWKVEVPGLGLSSPVICSDSRVLITTPDLSSIVQLKTIITKNNNVELKVFVNTTLLTLL